MDPERVEIIESIPEDEEVSYFQRATMVLVDRNISSCNCRLREIVEKDFLARREGFEPICIELDDTCRADPLQRIDALVWSFLS